MEHGPHISPRPRSGCAHTPKANIDRGGEEKNLREQWIQERRKPCVRAFATTLLQSFGSTIGFQC